MSIHSKPLSPEGRDNFDRIFRRDKSGVRVWRSDCCEAEINAENRCVVCDKRCNHKLVETDE